jgi:hypothetical protein
MLPNINRHRKISFTGIKDAVSSPLKKENNLFVDLLMHGAFEYIWKQFDYKC